jgi:NADH:ubiquinone oxidoreductase subunit 4 (subunit M)
MQPFANTVFSLSVIFASFSIIAQTDIKRIIAYSSIIHIDIGFLGIFSLTNVGFIGNILILFSHGIVSTALFFSIGVLYSRYHTRLLDDFSNLQIVIPVFAGIFIFFIFSNIGFPLSGNYVSEIIIVIGNVYNQQVPVILVICVSIIVTLYFTLNILQSLLFGNFFADTHIKYRDLTRNEFFVLIYLAWLNLWVGVYPIFLIRLIYSYVGCYFSEYGAFNLYTSDENDYDEDFINNLYSDAPAESPDTPLVHEPWVNITDTITDEEKDAYYDKVDKAAEEKKIPLQLYSEEELRLMEEYIKKRGVK